MQMASTAGPFRVRQFLSLTKPRVVSLIVFCAVIGMYLAVPGWVPRNSCSPRPSASGWLPGPLPR